MRKRETAPDAFGAEEATDGDRRFVTALARGLDVLRAFRSGDSELGNQDFAERTGLPKPTISRLTYTLSKLGYLAYNQQTGRYRLDAPVMALGYSYLADLGPRRRARPLMQALADHAGLPVALGARDRLSMIYLECCRSENLITLAIEVGAHIKLATSAMGRAFIAGLPEPERKALLAEIAAREGANWPKIEDGVLEALESYRQHGFCLSLGAWKSDVNTVGVPYAPRDGSPVLAFNCGGPSFLVDRARLMEDVGPRLVDLARRLHAPAEY